MTPVSLKDFYEQSETLFEDLSRETGRRSFEIGEEYYQFYLESIEDRDND